MTQANAFYKWRKNKNWHFEITIDTNILKSHWNEWNSKDQLISDSKDQPTSDSKDQLTSDSKDQLTSDSKDQLTSEWGPPWARVEINR